VTAVCVYCASVEGIDPRHVALAAEVGTRIAALGLLIMKAVIQIYIMPEHLWTTQIYWFAILTVLLSQGAGQISADHVIRILNRHASRRA